MNKKQNIYFGLDQNLNISIIFPESNKGPKIFQQNLNFFEKNGFELKNPNFKNYTCDIKIKNIWEKWYLGWIVSYAINQNPHLRIQIRKQNNPHKINRIFGIKKFTNRNLLFLTENNLNIINKTEHNSSFMIALSKPLFWKRNGDFYYEHNSRARKTKILLFSDIQKIKSFDLNNFDNNTTLKKIDDLTLKNINIEIKSKIKQLKIELTKQHDNPTVFKPQKSNHEYLLQDQILDSDSDSYERITQTIQRKHQEKWRKRILLRFNNTCFVTGINNPSVVQACHIKPWRNCVKLEKIDLKNGILLSPTFHVLYDEGLITFLPNGKMLFSSKLNNHTINLIKQQFSKNINNFKNMITKTNSKYFEYHRNNIFKDK